MVIVLGQEESRTLRHDRIGTEHILLGLLREKAGVAARVMQTFGITADRAREQLITVVGTGEAAYPGQIPFTPRAKKVLEEALAEALRLHHSYIGTEHVLLALANEDEGPAARVLADLQADPKEIRREVLERLRAGEGGPDEDQPAEGPSVNGIGQIELSERVERLLMAAAGRSLGRGDTLVDLPELLAEIAEDESALTFLATLLSDKMAGEGPRGGIRRALSRGRPRRSVAWSLCPAGGTSPRTSRDHQERAVLQVRDQLWVTTVGTDRSSRTSSTVGIKHAEQGVNGEIVVVRPRRVTAFAVVFRFIVHFFSGLPFTLCGGLLDLFSRVLDRALV